MADVAPPTALLIVDDSADIRRLMSSVLEQAGFAVATAADGAAALEYLADHQPAAILLDLMLPGLSGLQILERIRAHPTLRGVPVVIVTGTMTHDRDLLGAGATAVLRKPFEPARLLDQVRAVLASARFESSRRP